MSLRNIRMKENVMMKYGWNFDRHTGKKVLDRPQVGHELCGDYKIGFVYFTFFGGFGTLSGMLHVFKRNNDLLKASWLDQPFAVERQGGEEVERTFFSYTITMRGFRIPIFHVYNPNPNP